MPPLDPAVGSALDAVAPWCVVPEIRLQNLCIFPSIDSAVAAQTDVESAAALPPASDVGNFHEAILTASISIEPIESMGWKSSIVQRNSTTFTTLILRLEGQGFNRALCGSGEALGSMLR